MRAALRRMPITSAILIVPEAISEKRKRRSVIRRAATVSAAIALAGCAGARVSNVAAETSAGQPPTEILIDVNAASVGTAEPQVAADIATHLRSDLLEHLTKARLAAEPYQPGASHRGAALLHVSITEAEPGSYVERFIVGFGLGRARLEAAVNLETGDTAPPRPMTEFSTSSATGRMMPGLILPIAVTVATKDLIPLAVGGGLKVATSFRGGLDNSAEETAKAIVAQLKKYYASAGWPWPAPDEG
ncbi:MAG TPA: DUF4410 domain-containing protein [Stellaceae bacterium]|nr:DUF4410 domain-containing protein [Stellaceae bacterium]